MFQIVALIIGVIALVIIGIGVIIGVLNGFKRSLASLISVVIAAVAATVITLTLCNPSSSLVQMLIGYATDAVSSLGELAGEIVAIGELVSLVTNYASMIIAPFFFLIVFALIALIVSVILNAIISFIPILRRKSRKNPKAVLPKLAYHFGGMIVGAVTGLLVALLAIFPVVGVASIAEDAVCKVPDEVFDKLGLSETLDALPIDIKSEHKVMQYFDFVGSGFLFDTFSSVSVDGERISLRQEMGVIADIALNVLDLDFNAQGLNDSHVEVAKNAVKDLDRSVMLRGAVAGVVSALSQNESIVTPELVNSNEMLTPIIEELLLVVSTTDKDTVIADLTTVVDVAGIVVESNILNESDYNAILAKIGDGLVSDLLIAVTANSRMHPVADEITVLSIRVLATELGVLADENERYDNLMQSVAAVLNDSRQLAADERRVKMIEDLDTVMDNYGVKIEGEALENVVDGLVADFGDKTNVSETDVTEFFMIYNVANEGTDIVASAGNGLTNLADEDSSVVIGEDGTITIGGVTLKSYTADNYRESTAYKMGQEGVNIGDASTLDAASNMKSTLLTAADIVASLGSYSDCEDVAAECEKIGAVFSEMVNVISKMDSEEFDATNMIGGIGAVLDIMVDTEIFGTEASAGIITMVLQSDTVVDTIGLSKSDMTEFANNINNFASDREGGYAEATNTIANTLNTITTATDKNASNEDKTNATANMIHGINKDNAELITSMITGDMLGNFGALNDKADLISSSLKSLIYNMAEYKEGNPDEESVNREAEAVTLVISLAIAGSNDDSIFNETAEDGVEVMEGVVGMDVDTFIAKMLDSVVVTETVSDTVDEAEEPNPYGITYGSEKERENVAEAIEKYYAEHAVGNDEELKEKLYDVAFLMDVEVELN